MLVNESQDVAAVRRLSAWMVAQRELQEYVAHLTTFGPQAERRVCAHIELVAMLEGQAHAAFSEYHRYVTAREQSANG